MVRHDDPIGPEDDGAAVNGPEITAPEAWDLVGRDMVSFVVNRGRVVVISAHPDDETLAIGGLLQSLHRAGARLEMVIATDGEAAFPSLGPDQRAALGRCRRAEMTEALRQLGLNDVPITWLGFPDSALREDDLSEALRPVIATADMCLAPWPEDPHPDHRAAGVAARAAAGPGLRSGVTRSGRGPGKTLARCRCLGAGPPGTAWTRANGDARMRPSRRSPLSWAPALWGSRLLSYPPPAPISIPELRYCSGCRLWAPRHWFVLPIFTRPTPTPGALPLENMKAASAMSPWRACHGPVTGAPWTSAAAPAN